MLPARPRTVSPCFAFHEGLVDLEKSTGLPLRLLFTGLWTVCDRDGRFRWQPTSIAGEVFPHDEFDIVAGLGVLARSGYLVLYEVDGERFGTVVNFHKWQHVNGRERASAIPAPGAGNVFDIENLPLTTPPHTEGGENPADRAEGNGRPRPGHLFDPEPADGEPRLTIDEEFLKELMGWWNGLFRQGLVPNGVRENPGTVSAQRCMNRIRKDAEIRALIQPGMRDRLRTAIALSQIFLHRNRWFRFERLLGRNNDNVPIAQVILDGGYSDEGRKGRSVGYNAMMQFAQERGIVQ